MKAKIYKPNTKRETNTICSSAKCHSVMSIFVVMILAFLLQVPVSAKDGFLRVQGKDIVDANGKKHFIKGTNLGNWVNPEGYMFGFRKTNSYYMINDMISQILGPAETAKFWKAFKDNYITEADIEFIASTGANTIRLPFHYKLFTNEDYMGLNDENEGFRIVDMVVEWCRKYGLYLILDMHDCPGGQTGDNIDDSYGYPWLMTDLTSQAQFINIWEKIAQRYKKETVILGYELMNEPIATYWEGEEKEYLNSQLEPLYKRTVAAIRLFDQNHIILLGGSQWNSNFEPFSDWTFDNNIMYTCHRYGGDASKPAIQSFIDFRDKTGLPMYMGEIGHNTDKWMSDFVDVMRSNNIGYTFWPFKKIEESSMTGIKTPEGWQQIVDFSEAPRGSYAEIREARKALDVEKAKQQLYQYVENAKFPNVMIHNNYIKAIKLNK